MSKHVMLDLETLGNGNNAAVVTIGAYFFDTKNPSVEKDFYRLINPASSVKAGMKIDVSTVLWWMGQSDEARQQIIKAGKEGAQLTTALVEFSEWYKDLVSLNDGHSIPVWGNGATFDNVIIASAFQCAGLKKPWFYREDRCYRTLANMNTDITKPISEGVAHHALDDAKWQAKHLTLIFEKLNMD